MNTRQRRQACAGLARAQSSAAGGIGTPCESAARTSSRRLSAPRSTLGRAQRERGVETGERQPLGQRRAGQVGPDVGGGEHVAGACERTRGLARRLRVRDDAAAHGHGALGAERHDRRRHEPRERHSGLLGIVVARDEGRFTGVQDERAGGADQHLGPPGALVGLHGVAGRVHARRVRVRDDALDVADHRSRRKQADVTGQQRPRVSRLHEGALARAGQRHADRRAHAGRADPVDPCTGQPGRQQRAEVVLAHRGHERAAQAEPRARDGDVAGATGSDLGARRVGELAVDRQGLESVEHDVDAGRADAGHVMGRSGAQRATSVARSSRMTVTRI